jgi:hypothetical protein
MRAGSIAKWRKALVAQSAIVQSHYTPTPGVKISEPHRPSLAIARLSRSNQKSQHHNKQ